LSQFQILILSLVHLFETLVRDSPEQHEPVQHTAPENTAEVAAGDCAPLLPLCSALLGLEAQA
jgi:hypothetical protein